MEKSTRNSEDVIDIHVMILDLKDQIRALTDENTALKKELVTLRMRPSNSAGNV